MNCVAILNPKNIGGRFKPQVERYTQEGQEIELLVALQLTSQAQSYYDRTQNGHRTVLRTCQLCNALTSLETNLHSSSTGLVLKIASNIYRIQLAQLKDNQEEQ